MHEKSCVPTTAGISSGGEGIAAFAGSRWWSETPLPVSFWETFPEEVADKIRAYEAVKMQVVDFVKTDHIVDAVAYYDGCTGEDAAALALCPCSGK